MLKVKKVFFVSIIITLGVVFCVQATSEIYADSQKDGETTIIYTPFESESESESKNYSKINIPVETKKENVFPKTNEKQNYCKVLSIGIGIILLVTSIYYLTVKKDHR